MPVVLDQELYDKVKKEADTIYTKPSAYKSGWIVRKYKSLGGKYKQDNEPKKLKQWFQANWKDIGNQSYPVYRPTIRVNKTTPLLVSEIDPKNLMKQIGLKQKYRGLKNLPPFKKIPHV
jgi:hypothetical protein